MSHLALASLQNKCPGDNVKTSGALTGRKGRLAGRGAPEDNWNKMRSDPQEGPAKL